MSLRLRCPAADHGDAASRLPASAGGALRLIGPRGRGSFSCGTFGVRRERAVRSCGVPFLLQLASGRSRARRRGRGRGLPSCEVPPGLLPRASRGLTRLRRWQLHAGAPCLREPDRNCLFGGSRAVFPFTYVVDLFPHKLSSLCGWRLAVACVLPRPLNRSFFRHACSSSPMTLHKSHPCGAFVGGGSGFPAKSARGRQSGP
jgi:hypothetical protein